MQLRERTWRKMVLVTVFFAFYSMHSPAQPLEYGKASFYAKWMNGRRTASGERLYNDSLQCAHRTYKFGTKLKVTNLSNKKSVIVKVIDRGPYRKGRIVDLTIEAARRLDMLQQGLARVIVEPVGAYIIPFRNTEIMEIPHIEMDTTLLLGVCPDWREALNSIKEQDEN